MATSFFPVRTVFSAAALSVVLAAQAQTTLKPVTITGKGDPVIAIGGWGDTPLSRSPFQATIISSEQMKDSGMTRLADVVRIDPSVSDAYNTEGYWDFLAVRGFLVDNRFNYRRDGLPINAETSLPLDNKDRVEILKGTSGVQAGTSAPGGLVNLVVKRPGDETVRDVGVSWRERGSMLGAVDLSQRFGEGAAFGLRVNAAAERMDPKVRSTRGERTLFAVAGDWRLSRETLLEAEFETSHRSQPSVPGFSLLGDTVPTPVDPRISLNIQPWSLPVVLDGNTGSLRFTHRLNDQWRATLHAGTQQLKSDDRIAFPFGCFDAVANVYYADRYCPNGDFDLYDFRSENERRRTDAVEAAVHGGLRTGPVAHTVSAGVLRSRFRARFQQQAFNFTGTGNVSGELLTPEAPALTDENTNRDERSTELFVRDAARIGERITLWSGLRHTRVHRESVRTDGSRPTAYDQSFTAPWLGLSVDLAPDTMVYASWGRGVESEVAPNRPRYANAGQALPALSSRQVEAGVKLTRDDWRLGAAVFDIEQPKWSDVGANCLDDSTPGSCERTADGVAQHRGIELSAAWQASPFTLQGGLQWLKARREGAANASVDGKRPTNVPAVAVKLQGRYDVTAVPGLMLQADWHAVGDRMVLEDNSVRVPGYARTDVGVRYGQSTALGRITWRAGIDNLFDKRAWRESAFQFGHVYLFPLAPRALRLSLEAAL